MLDLQNTLSSIGTTLGIAAGVLGGEYVGRAVAERVLPNWVGTSTGGQLGLDLGMFVLGRYMTRSKSVHLQRLGTGVKVGATLHGVADVMTNLGNYYGGDFEFSTW